MIDLRKNLASLLLMALAVGAAQAADDRQTVIVVVGAPGSAEFGARFKSWSEQWRKAAEQGGAECVTLGDDESKNVHEQLQQRLATEVKKPITSALWIVYLGHGTYDTKSAKWNVRGPDVSADDLSKWLADCERPVAIVNTSAASSPFLAKLSAEGRVVITATKSGHERNFARLGQYISAAISSSEADLDGDGQTSLLEAFLLSSRQTAEFYETEGRLATEHALLDDNGDRLGTRSDWFRGIRAVKRAKGGAKVDGYRAHQFHLLPSEIEASIPASLKIERDELERKIRALRDDHEGVDEADYLDQLEVMLLRMAEIYGSTK